MSDNSAPALANITGRTEPVLKMVRDATADVGSGRVPTSPATRGRVGCLLDVTRPVDDSTASPKKGRLPELACAHLETRRQAWRPEEILSRRNDRAQRGWRRRAPPARNTFARPRSLALAPL